METLFATYWKYLLQLDVGISLVSRKPVLETLVSKLRYSISLSVTSLGRSTCPATHGVRVSA